MAGSFAAPSPLRRKLEHRSGPAVCWRLRIRCGAPRKPAKAGRKYHEEIGFNDISCRCLGGLQLCADLPKPGKESLVQAKSKQSTGCKLVGTVKGTKLWAGDCVAAEPVAP